MIDVLSNIQVNDLVYAYNGPFPIFFDTPFMLQAFTQPDTFCQNLG